MLSKATLYLQWYHVVLLLVLVGWWLIGASWLLQLTLRKWAGQRRQAYGPCVLAMLLAGIAAGIIGGLAWMLVSRVGDVAEDQINVLMIGMVAAGVLGTPTFIFVLYATLDLRLLRLLLVSWPAVASIAAAAAVVGVVTYFPMKEARLRDALAGVSVNNLQNIDKALREYEAAFDDKPPPDLNILCKDVMVRGKPITYLKQGALSSPFFDEPNTGYFYYPELSTDPKDANYSKTLIVGELTHAQSERYRSMLFANGEARCNPDQEYQAMLKLPENEEFARHFRAADANRPQYSPSATRPGNPVEANKPQSTSAQADANRRETPPGF